ncbi:MAG: NrsF family protein [Hyphomicrobium sp.]|nr:DUF1109 family protein [Hyphomicrobium sp.]
MKTDDLIKMLAADNASVAPPISRTMVLALAAGMALAAAHFFTVLAVRPDFSYAITHEARFIFKFVFTLGLALPAGLLVLRLARPDGTAGVWKWLLILPLALLAIAVGLEMQVVPADHWRAAAMGSMPVACMKYIPLLSLTPLLAMLIALRAGAPSNPTAAGAAAGLVSAGIAAALYATFCADDSPMFVAIWYVIGISIVVAIGALAGNRLLRW